MRVTDAVPSGRHCPYHRGVGDPIVTEEGTRRTVVSGVFRPRGPSGFVSFSVSSQTPETEVIPQPPRNIRDTDLR